MHPSHPFSKESVEEARHPAQVASEKLVRAVIRAAHELLREANHDKITVYLGREEAYILDAGTVEYRDPQARRHIASFPVFVVDDKNHFAVHGVRN